MAEGKWEKRAGGNDFLVNGKTAGFVYRLPSGGWHAFVVPPDGLVKTKEVADRTTESEAKKAVEKYWADKEPAA